MNKNEPIVILGAGSWGSAVAIHLARSGNHVLLWGHDKSHIETLKQTRSNNAYLPGFPFPDTLTLESHLDGAIKKARHILIAVPSHAFKTVLKTLPKKTQQIAWLTKGLEPESDRLLSDVVFEHFPGAEIAIISGPSFAKEVAANLPTAITLASNSTAYAESLHALLHTPPFRVYFSDDIIGVQVAGAIKNVLAIAVGISDGLGYGANARAALITRGLKEMARLGVSMGAKEKTFMGLAGIGDLLLTATDNQSRNRRFGLLIGKGYSLIDAEKEIRQVIEGRFNAKQVINLAQKHQLNLPICDAVNQLLNNKIEAEQAVKTLFNRPATYE